MRKIFSADNWGEIISVTDCNKVFSWIMTTHLYLQWHYTENKFSDEGQQTTDFRGERQNTHTERLKSAICPP